MGRGTRSQLTSDRIPQLEPDWENRTLFHGDNLPVLRSMNSESVDLIVSTLRQRIHLRIPPMSSLIRATEGGIIGSAATPAEPMVVSATP